MKRALLVVVHGSPVAESNDPMFEVIELVRREGVFPLVEVGFLDLNEPDVPTAISRCVEQGAGELIVVPYFLHAGRHVTRDLPDLLESARERYPDLKILMGDFIGSRPEMMDVVADRVRQAEEAAAGEAGDIG